jgi:hypothetical protein
MHLKLLAAGPERPARCGVGSLRLHLDRQSAEGHRLIEKVQSGSPYLPLTEYPERTQGIGYHRSAAFKIMANAEGAELEIGDGGFVGWTAELIPRRKITA